MSNLVKCENPLPRIAADRLPARGQFEPQLLSSVCTPMRRDVRYEPAEGVSRGILEFEASIEGDILKLGRPVLTTPLRPDAEYPLWLRGVCPRHRVWERIDI